MISVSTRSLPLAAVLRIEVGQRGQGWKEQLYGIIWVREYGGLECGGGGAGEVTRVYVAGRANNFLIDWVRDLGERVS